MRATDLAHVLVRQALRPGAIAVDATTGNGGDTAFLADCVGVTGRVFGFDVQEAALAAAAGRLGGASNVTLIHGGHEHLARHLPAHAKGSLAAVMFNLGYLPGSSKTIVTRPVTTLAALDQALAWLAPGGIVTLVLYTGHPGGAEEAAAVRARAGDLPSPFSATHCARINARDPAPELIAITRRG
jgi:predicted methyltransferase